MEFAEAVFQILGASNVPLTPQQIREQIKEQFPHLYGTEVHRRNVDKGHYNHLDHALLAQIYSMVGTGSQFNRDKSVKPMRVSLIADEASENDANENYDSEFGIVYVLSTGVYTKQGRAIVKIGQTTQSLEARIAQLYTTGSPFRFEVLQSYKTRNYVELEQALHRLLAPYRINKGREFFTDHVLQHIKDVVDIHERVQHLAQQGVAVGSSADKLA